MLEFFGEVEESPLPFDESAGFTAPSAFGTYRVLHQIGSGVLGPVFRTYDPQRDRLVAVKAFRFDVVPEQVARLADALRRLAASGLSHPNIVPPLDAGLEGTTAYLATEYVAAETLDVAMRHLAPAPIERALPILTQIADAIDASWAAGSGHGALHPRDVFVTVDTNEVRVTGFGVVPALESLGIKAAVRRPYAAPERVSGEFWDIRADVYSLGAIAHELLTKRRPAGSGEQDGALTTGTTAEQRVQIRRVLSAVLAERPQHRFASARAFVDALSAISRGEAVEALPAVEVEEEDRAEGTGQRAEGTGQRAEGTQREEDEGPSGTTTASGDDEPKVGTTIVSGDVEPTVVTTVVSAAAEPKVAPLVVTPDPADLIVPVPPPPPVMWRPAAVTPPVIPAPPAPYPWPAIVAAAVAGLVLGIVVDRQFFRDAAPAAPPAAAPAVTAARAGDTDVPVPSEPSKATAPAPAAAEVSTTRAPAPGPGRLTVRSTPPGALLVVDGRPRGQTPVTVRDLAIGAHAIEVGRPGYVPHTESVTITAKNAVRTLAIRLQAGKGDGGSGPGRRAAGAPAATLGSIDVDSRPQAARVIIDGRSVGTTPLRVPEMTPGSHTVRLELAGHKPFVTTVTVKAGEAARVTAALEEGK